LALQWRSVCAVTFPHFVSPQALKDCLSEAREQEDDAFTTDDTHTVHLLATADPSFPEHSVRNYSMRTRVASIAFDELPQNSRIAALYRHPTLRSLVSSIVKNGEPLYLSDDPLGCCSINVFRPDYHHSFHFDESEFSTTLMIQESEESNTGLFQYTHPLRQTPDDLALDQVASILKEHDETTKEVTFAEQQKHDIELHTLEFTPGTLSIFSGSKSLHRVTRVQGNRSRLVAVLTFASEPGFRNSPEVQTMFWGRSAP